MTNTLDESHWGGPYHSDSHTIITVWVRWHVFKFPFKHLLLCLWLLLLSPLSLFFLENYPKRQQMVTKKLSWDAFLRTWVCAFWVQHWEVWVCKGNKKKKTLAQISPRRLFVPAQSLTGMPISNLTWNVGGWKIVTKGQWPEKAHHSC